jgi:lambda repressor-like predicted transcriptional regulator
MGEENLHSCNQSQAWNAATMQIRNVHDLGMTNLLTQETARDFLRAAIQRSGLKPSQLAKKAGVAPSTITRPLSDPLYEFIPKASTLAKIAEDYLPSGTGLFLYAVQCSGGRFAYTI